MPYGIPEGKISINRNTRNALAVLCLMVFVCSFMVYANTLKGDFVWDDEYLITKNPQVKSFSHLPEIFTRYLGYGSGNRNNFYRPVQELSYMADHAAWGGSPGGFHFTNAVLHSLVSVLVLVFIFYLSGDIMVSGIAALFFAVHPVHTEAVSYIAGRADPLYALFSLGAIILFIRYAGRTGSARGRRFLLGSSLALYVLAMASKETAMVVPIVIFLYVFFFIRGVRPEGEYKSLRWGFLPYAAVLAVYLALRLTVLDFSDLVPPSMFREVPLGFRLITFIRSLWVYVRILILPYDLHMERTITIAKSLLDIYSIAAISGAAAVSLAAIYLYLRNRLASFALIWFGICLLPFSNIVPINSLIAEHWIYMASIGYFILAGMAVSWGYKKISGDIMWRKLAYFTALGAVIGAYAWITVGRNMEWSDEEIFYKSTLRYQPSDPRLYLNLGNTYYERGDMNEAIKCYIATLKLKPGYVPAYGNIGSCFIVVGDWDRAEKYLLKAVQLEHDYPSAHYNLGLVYYNKGEMDKAQKELFIATEQMPQLYQAWNLLGKVYSEEGNNDGARMAFERSLKIFPGQPEMPEKYAENNKIPHKIQFK